MNGFSSIFRGGFDNCGHFIGGEFHADDCDCGSCEATEQHWQVLHSDRMLDFETMANDIRRCAGVSIAEAKQTLTDSKVGDCFLDCIRIS